MIVSSKGGEAPVTVASANKLGDHPIISRFMSGLFNLKPTSLAKIYRNMEPTNCIEHLKTYPPVTQMSLKQMTMKLTILMALSAEHTQTLHLLSLDQWLSTFFAPGHTWSILIETATHIPMWVCVTP